ncbi:MAG: hypothetical protein CL678_07645 [Bdellovibrionaceae bacterium]|nr:hypothetical protein [Pseudobdellovibrionaceae bacterium]|tara:strand:- start:547 stop:2172 length:1626 start_codon:yes stop_codon:yes gene_type:complete
MAINFFKKNWELFLLAVVYILFSWQYSVPLTGDQKVYISTAMEMRLHNSFLYPYLFGETSYYKPPFVYWSLITSWLIFGFNQFATVLPGILAVLISSFFLKKTYLLFHKDRLLESSLIPLFFGSSMGVFTFGLSAQMEIYLVLFYILSWYFVLRFLHSKNFVFLFIAFFFVGILSIVKSPLYSVLWSIGFAFFLFLSNQKSVFSNFKTYGALLFGIFVASSWFVFILSTDSERFLNRYLYIETLSKINVPSAPTSRIWTDYLTFIFPFGVFLPFVIFKNQISKREWLFLGCWSLPIALFFSLFPYKTETYLFPMLPAWVLGFVLFLNDSNLKKMKRFVLPRMIIGFIFLFIGPLISVVLYRAEMIDLFPAFVMSAASLFGVLANLFLKNWRAIGLSFVVLIFGIILSVRSMGEKEMAPLRSAVAFSGGVELIWLDEVSHIWHEIGLVSAALGREINRIKSFENYKEALFSGAVAIASPEDLKRVENDFPGRVNSLLVWRRWKTRNGFPFKELLLYGKKGFKDYDQRLIREFYLIQLHKKQH